MGTTSQAYGLIPHYHPSGQSRANKYTIATGYGTAIYKGDLVKIHTDGTLNIGDGTTDAIGVFAGVEYVDANGKPTESPYWPASTTATNIVAYVYDDQQTVFRIGVTANASSYDQAAIGQQANVAIAAGSTQTGVSGTSLTAAPEAAGQVAQVRIIGYLNGEVYNATTNPYPCVLCQISQHQFVADKAGV